MYYTNFRFFKFQDLKFRYFSGSFIFENPNSVGTYSVEVSLIRSRCQCSDQGKKLIRSHPAWIGVRKKGYGPFHESEKSAILGTQNSGLLVIFAWNKKSAILDFNYSSIIFFLKLSVKLSYFDALSLQYLTQKVYIRMARVQIGPDYPVIVVCAPTIQMIRTSSGKWCAQWFSYL